MKKYLHLLSGFLLGIFSLLSLTLSSSVPIHAAPEGNKSAVCGTLGSASESVNTDCTEAVGGVSVLGVLKGFLNILTFVAGAVAVIMVVIGGFKYVVSQGDSSSVASARKSIIYALAGVAVVLFAQTIVRFLLDSV